MKREQIRQELMAYLRASLKDTSSPGAIQLMNVYHHFRSKVGHPAVGAVHQTARELLQEFVNNNLLYIGHGDAEGFPWFTITEYGKHCVNDGNLLPFDPDGYLVTLNSRVPGLDANRVDVPP